MCKRQHRKCIIFVKKIEKNRMFWWNACCIAGFWQQQKMKKKKYFISTERMTTKKRVWWHNVYAYIFFRSLVFHQNVRFRGNWIFIFNWFNVYLAKSLLFYAYNAFYFYLNEESTFFNFFQLFPIIIKILPSFREQNENGIFKSSQIINVIDAMHWKNPIICGSKM